MTCIRGRLAGASRRKLLVGSSDWNYLGEYAERFPKACAAKTTWYRRIGEYMLVLGICLGKLGAGANESTVRGLYTLDTTLGMVWDRLEWNIFIVVAGILCGIAWCMEWSEGSQQQTRRIASHAGNTVCWYVKAAVDGGAS